MLNCLSKSVSNAKDGDYKIIRQIMRNVNFIDQFMNLRPFSDLLFDLVKRNR